MSNAMSAAVQRPSMWKASAQDVQQNYGLNTASCVGTDMKLLLTASFYGKYSLKGTLKRSLKKAGNKL